jgi:hypothetical protein
MECRDVGEDEHGNDCADAQNRLFDEQCDERADQARVWDPGAPLLLRRQNLEEDPVMPSVTAADAK